MPKKLSEKDENNEGVVDNIPTKEIEGAKRKKLGAHRGGSNRMYTDDDVSTISSSPPCTRYNFFNLLFYVLNATCIYGVGVFGILENPTVAEITEKYRTLLTPVSWAFSIWVLIFISQGTFVLFQLGPAYRNLPIIQEGVKYWYILVCLSQIAWVFSFVYNLIALSLGLITLVLLSLLGCLRSISSNTPPGQGLIPPSSNSSLRSSNTTYTVMSEAWEYVIFRFPFYVHTAWIFVATLLNANAYLVYRNFGINGQLWCAIMSLSILLGVAVGVLLHRTSPDYAVPTVLAFATATIALEVSNPTEYISATFDQHTIEKTWASCVAVTVLIIVLVFLRLTISGCQRLRDGGRDDEYDVEAGSYVNIDRMRKGYI